MSSAKFRVALPDYNALTDTDIDHFSIYSDEDNVLIKEKTRDSISVPSSTLTSVSHGLDYVPLCFCFVEVSTGLFRRVDGNTRDLNYKFYIDDEKLYFYNLTGSTKTFYYYIFYEEITSGSPTITESDSVLKIVKSGYNALTDTNPNHYIFHSDLNTFKLIATGNKIVTLTASTTNQTFTQAHGLSFAPLCHGFAKNTSADRIFLPNSEDIEFYNDRGLYSTGAIFNYIESDSTNIYFNFDSTSGSDMEININYYAWEKI
jgi:hypothetical protein